MAFYIGIVVASAAKALAKGAAVLARSLRTEPFQRYQPERYYMRGPGPKWRAKHDAELETISRRNR
jgi:hypothetical protein